MANYVVVDIKAGKWVTFYPWGEVTTKSNAAAIVADRNEEVGYQAYKIMPEMEYYKEYSPDTYKWFMKEKERSAKRKEERARIRASRKAWKAKQDAKKSHWLPGGILNFR